MTEASSRVSASRRPRHRGIRQSRRKIPHSDCTFQKTFDSCPVRNTCEAPKRWRGVQKTCQGGCSTTTKVKIRGVFHYHEVKVDDLADDLFAVDIGQSKITDLAYT